MFCSRGGKERGWPWMFFSPLSLPYRFFSFCLWALFHGSFWYPHVRWNLSDLWHSINILLTWITLSIHAFSKEKKKYLDLFPTLIEEMTWSNSCLISASLVDDSFSASFHLFCSFSKSSLRWKARYRACMWSLTRISIVCYYISLIAHWRYTMLWWCGM